MTEPADVPFGLEVSKGVIAKFLQAAIGFAGSIAFARLLGPLGFGGFYLLWSIVEVLNRPIVGVGEACKKRFSESNAERGKILGTVGSLWFSASVLVGVAAYLFRGRLAAYTGLDDAHILLVVLFSSVILFMPAQALLAGKGRFGLAMWIDLLRSILTTPLQLVLILAGLGAAGMAFGLAGATVLSLPVSLYYLDTRPELPNSSTLASIWEFARYSVLSTSVNKVYHRFDTILLGAILAPTAVAHYEVAWKLTLPAVLLSEVTGEGLMARVSNMASRGQSVDEEITNSISFSSVFAVPLLFGSLALAKPLVVTVYGPEFKQASALLVGLAAFRLVASQSNPLSQVLFGLEKPESTLKTGALALGVNVVLGVVLTLRFGAVGIVAATVIAETIKYVIFARIVADQVEGVSLFPSTLLEQFGAATVMFLIVEVADRFVAVNSWIHLVGLVGLGGIVYATVLVVVSRRVRATATGILRDAGLDRRVPGRR